MRKNTHGGSRANAGRPKKPRSVVALQLFPSKASAGRGAFLSDESSQYINLNECLVKHPHDSFCLKVQGDSMIDAHIYDGDLIVVDRLIEDKNNKIVVALWLDEVFVKILLNTPQGVYLNSANKNYPNIFVNNVDDLKIFGVVTAVVHSL